MTLGIALMSFGLLMFLFFENRFAYFAFTGLIGLGNVIYMAIPYSIVSLVIPSEELGNNLGILNCFCVVGQQISNFAIGTGLGKVGNKIGYSSVVGFLAAAAALLILQPNLAETRNYNPILDESGTGGINTISLVE